MCVKAELQLLPIFPGPKRFPNLSNARLLVNLIAAVQMWRERYKRQTQILTYICARAAPGLSLTATDTNTNEQPQISPH